MRELRLSLLATKENTIRILPPLSRFIYGDSSSCFHLLRSIFSTLRTFFQDLPIDAVPYSTFNSLRLGRSTQYVVCRVEAFCSSSSSHEWSSSCPPPVTRSKAAVAAPAGLRQRASFRLIIKDWFRILDRNLESRSLDPLI
ncbi:Uncharacterized protein Rs2_23783 [Raphanus sativus]|nr:Uncharacterized protein Rs2_23783 [Raphanus sativus]